MSTTSSRSREYPGAEEWKSPSQVGDKAYGKELSQFNVMECGTKKLKVQQKFQNKNLDKSMGVEVSFFKQLFPISSPQ